MANHVPDQSSQNAAMFSDFQNYNFHYDQGQPFANGLLPDHQQQHTPQLNGTPSHSPFNHSSTFSPPPAWQNASSMPTPQPNPYMNVNRGYYNPQPTNNTNNFYGGHGTQFNQNVDPSLLRQAGAQSYPQNINMPTSTAQNTSTVTPSALQQTLNRPVANPSVSMQSVFSMAMSNNPSRDMAVRSPAVNGNVSTQVQRAPKGTQQGNFIIVSYDELAKATQSKKLARYANISTAPVELNLTKVNIPQYAPRHSQNQLKSLAASDPTVKAKITKRAKKTKLHLQKIGQPMRTPASKDSPVSLSSETESSDDDSDSSYDSDGSPPPEKSPLPATRPQKAVEAVRYDTIKAVWFPRNKYAENQRILKGLADLWEVVRTIRDRWKSDREAVKKALELKQEGELPLLRERVEKQLEMMEAVLSAASEFGHQDLLSAYVFSPTSLTFHVMQHSTHAFTRDAHNSALLLYDLFKLPSFATCTGFTVLAKVLADRMSRTLQDLQSRERFMHSIYTKSFHDHMNRRTKIYQSLRGHKNWPELVLHHTCC